MKAGQEHRSPNHFINLKNAEGEGRARVALIENHQQGARYECNHINNHIRSKLYGHSS